VNIEEYYKTVLLSNYNWDALSISFEKGKLADV
jgi:hypothetical protein